MSQTKKKNNSLSAARKARRKEKNPNLATPETISQFSVKQTVTSLHAASPKGINVGTLLATSEPPLFLSGGKDGSIIIVNVNEGEIVWKTIKAHSKKVSALEWGKNQDGLFLSGGGDGIVKGWKLEDKEASNQWENNLHSAEICGISLHPTGNFAVSAGADGKWALFDTTNGKEILSVSDSDIGKLNAKFYFSLILQVLLVVFS